MSQSSRLSDLAAAGDADYLFLRSQLLQATQPETETGLDRSYAPPKSRQLLAFAKWIDQNVGTLADILQWPAGAHDFSHLPNWQRVRETFHAARPKSRR